MFRFAENSRCRENEIPAFAGMEGLVELAASFSFGDRWIFAFAGMEEGDGNGMAAEGGDGGGGERKKMESGGGKGGRIAGGFDNGIGDK